MTEEILVKTFKILKKGRKYFETTLVNKYKAKLIISDVTKDFEIGKEYELEVNDLSLRSKYGTQLTFEAKQNIETNETPYLVKLDHYNLIFCQLARRISGKWSKDDSLWSFPSIAAEEAEHLDYLFSSEKVTVEIFSSYGQMIYADCGPITFRGIIIAEARSRDSGADLGDNIVMVKGAINSGGSMKNWVTRVEEGSVFRLEVSKPLLEELKDEDPFAKEWQYKIIENKRV